MKTILFPGLFLVALLCVGCSQDRGAEDETIRLPLEVEPDAYDFSANPELLERVLASPHGYFRFINREFSQLVCERFRPDLALIPDVNLHGDAHVEQYTVTEVGRGLADFDDSSIGPPILDLIRFGVSLSLVCRENGWEDRQDGFIEEFLRGYRAALNDPKIEPTPPPLTKRLRAGFTSNRSAILEEAESLMEPLDRSEAQMMQAEGREQYLERMHAAYPELPATFFDVKRMGRLRMGVGSALDEKYLMRVEGSTASPDDDVILEAKEVRDLSGIDCIQATGRAQALRPITAQARIAYQPYPFVGYEIIHPRKGDARELVLWIHGWFDHYKELSVEEDFAKPEDLSAVAFDVGVQLGLGHPKKIADPHEEVLRLSLLQSVDEFDEDLHREVGEFTQMSVAAWEAFRQGVREKSASGR